MWGERSDSVGSSIKVLLMTGGSGTRLWPKSRNSEPKQFMSLGQKPTLFQQTLHRVRSLVPETSIYAVTPPEYLPHIHRQAPELPVSRIIVEPMQHSTTACLGYAMAWLQESGLSPEDVVVVLPTDAYVGDDPSYIDTLKRAIDVAMGTDGIVTIGIQPDHPATGYGYIQCDVQRDSHHGGEGTPGGGTTDERSKADGSGERSKADGSSDGNKADGTSKGNKDDGSSEATKDGGSGEGNKAGVSDNGSFHKMVRPSMASRELGAYAGHRDAPIRVSKFVEKPDYDEAEEYLRQGGYFWNAGMFVWKAATIWELFASLLPAEYHKLGQIGAKLRSISSSAQGGRARVPHGSTWGARGIASQDRSQTPRPNLHPDLHSDLHLDLRPNLRSDLRPNLHLGRRPNVDTGLNHDLHQKRSKANGARAAATKAKYPKVRKSRPLGTDVVNEETDRSTTDLNFERLRRTPEWQAIKDIYAQFPQQSFEISIVENAPEIYMVPGRFPWTDLGTWSVFLDKLGSDSPNKHVVSMDATGCQVDSQHGLVGLLGVQDLIVVNTEDAVFICHRGRDQDVKKFRELLKELGYEDYL
jgi:mannose-1-phosphate guanylyltransferase